MTLLGDVAAAVDAYDAFVTRETARARSDAAFAVELRERWSQIRARIGETTSPTGTPLARLALPVTDEPGAIAEYLYGQGLPGDFPFANAAYEAMYLDGGTNGAAAEEPTRLFAGLGLAEDTNARFKYLARHQPSTRLSTAFDGPTLYGLDSDHEGVLGKVGEGGVAIDTVEDMTRLFAGFDEARPFALLPSVLASVDVERLVGIGGLPSRDSSVSSSSGAADSASRIASAVATADSRTTLVGSRSSSKPLNAAWRTIPSRDQPPSSARITISGFTHRTSRSSPPHRPR